MKGIVTAGGLGTRLHPMTKVVNKHLLDVFDEPIIQFPIKTLAAAGVLEITIVTGDQISQFKELLGDGGEFGVSLQYAFQPDAEAGIADAISRAEETTAGEDQIAVILGDNIFQDDLKPYVDSYRTQDKGAKVLLKQVSMDDAHRFGVAEVENGKIISIEEKPEYPRSTLVQTGFYMYDGRVFDFIRLLKPSPRGQLEVTDLNNLYIEEGSMTYDVVPGWWTDAGTPASKLKASIMVALEKGVHFHR